LFVLAILALNLMMPVAIKLFHTEADAVQWFAGTDVAELWMWRFLMPMVVLGGLIVPQMERRTFGDCGVGWLSLVLTLLLVLGSALHLCSLGYVYSIPWNTVNALPVIWAATWLIWWRRVEWAPEGNEVMARRSVLVPGLFGVLPFLMPVNDTLFFLNLINLLFCIGIFLRTDRRVEIQAVATLALVGVLKSIPAAMLAGPLVGTTRVQLLMLAGSVVVFAIAVFKRTPGWGIAAAISAWPFLAHPEPGLAGRRTDCVADLMDALPALGSLPTTGSRLADHGICRLVRTFDFVVPAKWRRGGDRSDPDGRADCCHCRNHDRAARRREVLGVLRDLPDDRRTERSR
jgi:hypothetical protein